MIRSDKTNFELSLKTNKKSKCRNKDQRKAERSFSKSCQDLLKIMVAGRMKGYMDWLVFL